MRSSREHALRLLSRLLGDRSRPEVEEEEPSPAEAREERFAAELAHGVVRHLSRIDHAIARSSGKPVARIAPEALNPVRLGVYQLLFTPSVPPYAAVSESVALARSHAPRAAGFVNWLLRRVGPDAAAPPRREEFADTASWLATLHSFPPWLVRRWLGRLGEDETGRLLAAMNEHPPPHLRANRLRANRDRVRDGLAAEGYQVVPGRYSPDALHASGTGRLTATPLFAAGAYYLQDESSQLAALLLAPRAGERVLDACAGVGGKSTHIAELTGGAAAITAVDRDARRLALLEENAARLGVAGTIAALRGDFLDPALLVGRVFDAVLLDAPCSGLGTIPRHPEVKWSKRPSDPARLALLQARMLERAAGLLEPGGRVLYSTCTTEPEECEVLVRAFLAGHPEFDLAPPPAGYVDRLDEVVTAEGFLRTWPHRHGIGAAFAALLRRRR